MPNALINMFSIIRFGSIPSVSMSWRTLTVCSHKPCSRNHNYSVAWNLHICWSNRELILLTQLEQKANTSILSCQTINHKVAFHWCQRSRIAYEKIGLFDVTLPYPGKADVERKATIASVFIFPLLPVKWTLPAYAGWILIQSTCRPWRSIYWDRSVCYDPCWSMIYIVNPKF